MKRHPEAAVFLALAFTALSLFSQVKAWAIDVGKPAPEFVLKDLDGRMTSITALRGKVIVLNFWATWCPPCRNEIPVLNNFYKKYRAKGLQVIGITRDDAGDIRSFMKEIPILYPVIPDYQAKAFMLYSVAPIPVTYVIDKGGTIRKKIMGEVEPAELEQAVRGIL
ncbi:MAG: TlpA disulfide reductase family protein [Nitrospiraceae bacterium]|nr:TlpA disulfide reductase family protein [Nitrospiraceae bacterium]